MLLGKRHLTEINNKEVVMQSPWEEFHSGCCLLGTKWSSEGSIIGFMGEK